MTQVLEFMGTPFLACLVLIGIHAYFGIHVIERGIIFVDLAMAQIAALGGMMAVFFHRTPNSPLGYALSLGSVVLGAFVLALTRHREQRVPQEAYIGIVYALALAASILLANWAPEGSEYVREMLEGVILWVRLRDVLLDAAVYGVIGLIHAGLFRRFWQISQDYEAARAAGIRVRWWDFVFYVTFGVVVIFSVRVAGVLLVFCFLVIPAVISALFLDGFLPRLLMAYGLGTLITVVGLLASWVYDVPSGPMVAVTFGVALLAAHLLRPWVTSASMGRRRLALAGVAVSLVAVLSALILRVHSGGPQARPPVHGHGPPGAVEASPSGDAGFLRLSPLPGDSKALTDLYERLLQVTDPLEKADLLAQIQRQWPHPPGTLPAELRRPPATWIDRYFWARLMTHWDQPEGLPTLCRLLDDPDLATARYRLDIIQILERRGVRLDYDPLNPEPTRYHQAVERCLAAVGR
jgi:zinc/manganese transport system permease protein